MKKLFGIKAGDPVDPDKLMLCLRIGDRHCSYAIVEKPSRSLLSLGYFTDPSINASRLDDLLNLQPELKQDFRETIVCYDYPQFIMTGDRALNKTDAGAILNTIFPAIEGTVCISDAAAGGKENFFRVPAQVHDWLLSRYRSPRIIHQYTLLMNTSGTGATGGDLVVDFRQEEFVLLAMTGGQPVLLQTFEYVSPDDVLYYLLKVCSQFGLNQSDVRLRLSGLVDRQSGLYNTLHQYFIHSDFRENGWNIPGSQYPPHFFTTLNDLALCGS